MLFAADVLHHLFIRASSVKTSEKHQPNFYTWGEIANSGYNTIDFSLGATPVTLAIWPVVHIDCCSLKDYFTEVILQECAALFLLFSL